MLLALLAMLAVVSCTQQSEAVKLEKFEVQRGTNVAHFLSQGTLRGEERAAFFTKKDIDNIVAMGFDHIRLPIDEEQMWDEEGNRHEEAFRLLEERITWCTAMGLRVIVDLHILRSHHFNAAIKPLWTDPKEREKFFDLWRDLSKDLKKFPNHLVAYELMNEAVADDHESWNKLLASAFKAIRAIEPERTIVIGSNRWQSAATFDALKVPANDQNILLSFHFYEPFLLSHYKAQWTNLKDYNGPVKYPGLILTQEEYDILDEAQQLEVARWVDKEFNKVVLRELWEQPIAKAEALGLPLYCGEFGIIVDAPEQDMLRWYEDMIALFEETGIGFANWNYKSNNFGLLSEDYERNEELIEIISVKKDD